MILNKNLGKLGTETAFAVSAEAKSWANAGNKVYPFHLGDINIQTPLVIRNATYRYMNEKKNGYCPSEGIPELREAIANDVGPKRNVSYGIDNVIIQPGGKPTIWKFLATVMNVGDDVLYPNPGYPIYESQIRYQGGNPVPYGYLENDQGFCIDLDRLSKSITKKTKILIYNNYQNPLSAASSSGEMEQLAKIAIENDLWVLSDDAYYEIRYTKQRPRSIVSIPGMKNRTVVLYTFSKKFAMTGWRLGASIGPSEIMKQIARFNINDESCTNHFIQHALAEVLNGNDDSSEKILDTLKKRRDKCLDILNGIEGLFIPKPESTFYLFPNVSGIMEKKGYSDLDKFRIDALKETGVSFCTRNHFGTPSIGENNKYIRLAYSGINQENIKSGLSKFKEWVE